MNLILTGRVKSDKHKLLRTDAGDHDNHVLVAGDRIFTIRYRVVVKCC